MNRYIWTEAQAKSDVDLTYKNGQPKYKKETSDKEVYETKYISLASEIAFSSRDKDKNEIEVSLAKRFPFLLYSRISDVISDDEFNVLMHYIADLDLKSGFEFTNIRKNTIEKEILENKYGRKVKDIFGLLDRETKDLILDCIFKYEMGNAESFISSVRESIGSCVFYKNEKMIILYIAEKKELTDEIVEMCRVLFLPVESELKVHYKYHIGIIGNDVTMKVGKIRII